MSYTTTEIPAAGFVEQIKVAAVYIECEGKYLFMRKVTPETVAGKWGVPGGKADIDEPLDKAALRELKEETGIEVCSNAIKYVKPLFIKTDYASFGFYIFAMSLKEMPEITLSNEHDKYIWATEHEVLELDMMSGGVEPFLLAQKHFASQRRPRATVSSYLILRNGEKVCLGKRQNTGYMDGYYGLISGHVEVGECASDGMIREAEEEAGIEIDPADLECVHIMHRMTPQRMNIDVFFECQKFNGEIENREPKKCAGWEFFDVNDLPDKTMDYVKQAIQLSSKGQAYSEVGFTKVNTN